MVDAATLEVVAGRESALAPADDDDLLDGRSSAPPLSDLGGDRLGDRSPGTTLDAGRRVRIDRTMQAG